MDRCLKFSFRGLTLTFFEAPGQEGDAQAARGPWPPGAAAVPSSDARARRPARHRVPTFEERLRRPPLPRVGLAVRGATAALAEGGRAPETERAELACCCELGRGEGARSFRGATPVRAGSGAQSCLGSWAAGGLGCWVAGPAPAARRAASAPLSFFGGGGGGVT